MKVFNHGDLIFVGTAEQHKEYIVRRVRQNGWTREDVKAVIREGGQFIDVTAVRDDVQLTAPFSLFMGFPTVVALPVEAVDGQG
ncbi:MAG: hypothetical protein ACRYFR_14280 [Janthinobacterium lividum]